MKVAFGHMYYSSNDFWSLSLREWQACLKGYIERHRGDSVDPMTRDELYDLMERYPDGTGTIN